MPAERKPLALVVHTEERLTLDDGAQTTLERWGERGPAIVAIHGMTGSRKAWEPFAEHYGKQARVYAYDQRGHGDSDVSGSMTLHRSLLDLHNVIAAIPDEVDTVIGHSWGGAIAILGGRRLPVRRVVAIDPLIRQMGGTFYNSILRDLKKQKMLQTSIKRLRDENPPQKWDLRGDLESYPKPLFLAVGEGSGSLVALEDLKYIQERGGANVALRVFEGHGHSPHRTDFERFTRALDAFMERTEAR